MVDQPPVHVSIVGTGTGDGGGAVVTPVAAPGATALASGTVGETPIGQPNILLNVVNPFIAILVRFAHVFLVTILAQIGVVLSGEGASTAVVPMLVLKSAAIAALWAGGVETVKNLITIFTGLEQKFPLGTGSI